MIGRMSDDLGHERDRRGGQNIVERATKDDRLEMASPLSYAATRPDKMSWWQTLSRGLQHSFPVRYLGGNHTPARCEPFHSNIGDILASTSSTIASGTLSSFLPPRAAKSRARGWSQRT